MSDGIKVTGQEVLDLLRAWISKLDGDLQAEQAATLKEDLDRAANVLETMPDFGTSEGTLAESKQCAAGAPWIC